MLLSVVINSRSVPPALKWKAPSELATYGYISVSACLGVVDGFVADDALKKKGGEEFVGSAAFHEYLVLSHSLKRHHAVFSYARII